MIRRRLRLSYSSDEDEEPPQQQPSATVTHPPGTQATPYPYPSEPLPLSSDEDEDFIDVRDSLSPPSPQPVPEPDNHRPPPVGRPGGCPVSEHLQGLGLRLRREWLDACALRLQQSVPGFRTLGAAAKAKLCFEQFLVSDMNLSGGGVLPPNVASLHLVDLPGPYVLQVDEIVNVSNPLKMRYQKASAGHKRCLKLSMTDGVQRVFAMEYRPIQGLDALAPAGLKVVVCSVHIRHGLLMLVPQSLELLGGLVEELDAARKRLVEEVNKPPRGNRTRNGVVPPLSNRAALAAWPPNDVDVAGQANSSTFRAPTPLQPSNQGGRNNIPMTTEETFPLRRERAAYQPSSIVVENMPLDSFPNGRGSAGGRHNIPMTTEETVLLRREHAAYRPSSIVVENMPLDSIPIPNSRGSAVANSSFSGFGVQRLHINAVPNRRETLVPNDDIPNPPFEDALDVEEDIDMDAMSINSETRKAHLFSEAILDGDDIHLVGEFETRLPNPSADTILKDNDINVVNEGKLPILLFGSHEAPFVYLATLSIRLKAMKTHSVWGNVKCFLTGVKSFQYKGVVKYDLKVYIDDGSMISAIVISHDVVQKSIGHPPEVVEAAASSPDKTLSSNMKEKLRQFQLFLINFEGIMLIEFSEDSLPVALDMNQGCPSSDAWLLLRRLKASTRNQTSETVSSRRAQTSQSLSSCPIDISP